MDKKNTPPVTPVTKNTNESPKANNAKSDNKEQTPQTKEKSKGKKVALILLLILLGLGGASAYFVYSHEIRFKQQINHLEEQVNQLTQNNKFVTVDQFASLNEQIQNQQNYDNQIVNKLEQQEKFINEQTQSIHTLQKQVDDLDTNQIKIPKSSVQPNEWLLAESDYLLNNALHKLIIDDDVETAIALLQVADETLSKIDNPGVIAVRAAINSDLKRLFAVNNVDQDEIMQHLSSLANQVDNLELLDIGTSEGKETDNVSDSVVDWKTNLKKSIDSFFDNFIHITKVNDNNKELLAPNQEIYLRENIRLRLQIAIIAVSRQQNTLYKQSLEMVSTWIRSYFDTANPEVQQYLTTLDNLSQQSININIPNKLTSLELLDQLLHKAPKKLQKIKIAADKSLEPNDEKIIKTEEASQAEEKPDSDIKIDSNEQDITPDNNPNNTQSSSENTEVIINKTIDNTVNTEQK